jgi:hypothetical protein
MSRCQYRHPSGKRCKAHRMAGSKFCLFHTPGQKMKRRKSSSEEKSTPKPKTRLRQSIENQVVSRTSKLVGNALVARGAYLQSNQSISFTKTKFHAARYNVQGTRIVGAHTQRTFMMRRTPDGRDFLATQTRANKRMVPHHIHMGKRVQLYGRLLPVLGFGYVMHNIYTGAEQPKMREGEGFWQVAALYGASDTVEYYKSGGTTTGLLTGGNSEKLSIFNPKSIVELFE